MVTNTTQKQIGPAFGTTVQPPLTSWPAIAKAWSDQPDQQGRPADLLALVNSNVTSLGSGSLGNGNQPLWVTGHQAWLWHPGILAKDLIATAAANKFGGDVLHLVVDHDIHDALHMQLPVQHHTQPQTQNTSHLALHELTLVQTRADIPSACQPPADLSVALENLIQTRDTLGDELVGSLDTLEAVIESLLSNNQLTAFETLGQQMAAMTVELLAPWTNNRLPMLLTSQLCRLKGFDQIVTAMLADAAACASAYNNAVLAHPQAGIGPLAQDRQFVELPLWLLTWQGRRQAVYADITDSNPILVTADGSPIDIQNTDDVRQPRLAPRAMLLTAIIRRFYATAFVHGTGGGVYDQATEAWWNSWNSPDVHGKLAPMTVATADLRMVFDLPSATRQQVLVCQQAVHHLKHNLNLEPGLSVEAQQLARHKADLLAHMHDDSDKRRKQAAFKEIHTINTQLAALMGDVLDAAKESLVQTRAGLKNQSLAMKRDWPFMIYPHESLAHLAKAMQA